MSNEQREKQMMAASEAYAAEIYKDEPDNFHTDEQLCETINDFCAGWRAADQHPQWIPVEEELPPKRKDPIVISDKVFIHTTGGHYLSAVYDHQDKEWIDEYNIETLEPNEVTHWMPIVPPRKEEKE